MVSRYDLRGRKAILSFFDLKAWSAIERKRAAGAPIFQEPDGTWVASSQDLDTWSTGRVLSRGGCVNMREYA